MGYSSRVRKCCVIIDTNILLLLADGLNVFEQIDELLLTKCEYIIPSIVIGEINKIASSGKNKLKRKALASLQLLERLKEKYAIRIVEINTIGFSVDDTLIDLAVSMGCYIASNDRGLRAKARRRSIPEIYYREEKGMLEASKEFI